MMMAVMMKADTRPARRGSRVGASFSAVVPPPTLSWDEVSMWAFAWALGLGTSFGPSVCTVTAVVTFGFGAGVPGCVEVMVVVGLVLEEVTVICGTELEAVVAFFVGLDGTICCDAFVMATCVVIASVATVDVLFWFVEIETVEEGGDF